MSFSYKDYANRIKFLFNDKRGEILSTQILNLKSPSSAIAANVLTGTSNLGVNSQEGLNKLPTDLNINFPIDHFLHCNVGLEWYFISTNIIDNNGDFIGSVLIIFLYHQLLPGKYCIPQLGTNLYSLGKGRVLETIVSINMNDKKQNYSKSEILDNENIYQNLIGEFKLPSSGIQFTSKDNTLSTFNIVDEANFNLNFSSPLQGPLLNTYGTGTCKKTRPFMTYTLAPLSVTGIIGGKNIKGVGIMDHQWGTISGNSLIDQMLNSIGSIKLSPINLGWGLTIKELVLGCNFNNPSFIKCADQCSIYMAGVHLFPNEGIFPIDISLYGTVPTGEQITVIYTLNVSKWVTLDNTKYPLYLNAVMKSDSLLPATLIQPISPPGGLPLNFEIQPIFENQRINWVSGGEAWEGGIILKSNNKIIGNGFLECVGWENIDSYTSKILKTLQINPTEDNIKLFSTRSETFAIVMIILIIITIILFMIISCWGAVALIQKSRKKSIYYPWKIMLSSFIIMFVIIFGILLKYK